MSKLRLRTKGFSEIALNVLSFSSPIFASTSSSQTSSSEQHFPIRCNQPNIRFDVIFHNEKEYEEYQTFIRKIQLKLLKGKDPNDVAVVTLWWPERNIENWQGLIKVADGGGERFNWAPQTTIDVELTKGIVATQSYIWSVGPDFDSIFGGTINTLPPGLDTLLTPPAPPSADGLNVTDLLAQTISPSTAPTPSSNPAGSLGSLGLGS